MNLFCSSEHLAEWRAAHPGEQGRERDLEQVSELGRAEWGDLRKRCNCQEGAPNECCRCPTLRWSNFEQVYADYRHLNVAGMIETDDGAEIRFDSRGFAVPPAGMGVWKVASAVRFAVNDSRYRWLETAPAIWEGEFDATTATARYRVYRATMGSRRLQWRQSRTARASVCGWMG